MELKCTTMVPCMPALPPITHQNRIIFAGLYPPTKVLQSQLQFDNPTSTQWIGRLGHDNFDWIDLYPFAPTNLCQDVDLSDLEKIVKDDISFAQNWIARVLQRAELLKYAQKIPIVYVCGAICLQEWKRIIDVGKERRLHETLNIVEYDGMIVFYGQHPSAHLHGGTHALAIFDRNVRILNCLLRGQLDNLTNQMHEDEKAQMQGLQIFCQHRWKQTHLPLNYEHLEHFPMHDNGLRERLSLVEDALLKQPSFTNRFVTPEFIQLYDSFPHELFTCNGFCTHILQPDFRNLYLSMGIDALKLFKTDAFCTHIQRQGFRKKFELLSNLNHDHAIKLFTTNSFCTHVLKDKFYTIFDIYYTRDPDCAQKLFSTDGFCTSVLSTSFLPVFEKLWVVDSNIALKLFTTSAFCKRANGERFLNKFYDCITAFGSAMTKRLFGTPSFNVHLQDDLFWEHFMEIYDEFGSQHCTKFFAQNAFSVRISKLKFKLKLDNVKKFLTEKLHLSKLFGTSQFCIQIEKNVNFWRWFQYFRVLTNSEDLTVKMFSNNALCQDISMIRPFNQAVQNVIYHYRHFADLLEYKYFTDRIQETDFLQYVQNDYSHMQPADFKHLYSNSEYVKYANASDFSNFLIQLGCICDRERVLAMLENNNFVKNWKNPQFYYAIQIWEKKVGFEAITRLLQIDTFCSKCIDAKNDFVGEFEELVVYCSRFAHASITEMSALDIAIFFITNRSFLTSNREQRMFEKDILKIFENMFFLHGWPPTLALFASPKFVARIENQKFFGLVDDFADKFGIDNCVKLFAHGDFYKTCKFVGCQIDRIMDDSFFFDAREILLNTNVL